MNNWWKNPAKAVDTVALSAAAARQQVLTKPAGSLGELESIAIRLAGMQGKTCPQLATPWISVFAADHGVAAAGVSAFPQAVTAQMVANFAAGGAAICVLARQIAARFEVVDVGVLSETSQWPSVVQSKVRAGSRNFFEEPAMTTAEFDAALAAGRAAVQRAMLAGADCFIAGEMGIGNTTSATALAATFLHDLPDALTGTGTGINNEQVTRKINLIAAALSLHAGKMETPQAVLATVGGLEIAAMTGAYLAAAQAGLPVIVDGVISTAAALAACEMNASVRDWLFFGHLSVEPAHARMLDKLQARPMLQMQMRLGEGSGAAAAFPTLQLACALHAQMATFAEASVSNRS